MKSLSDRMRTKAVGRRTPNGGLGTFWDDEDDDDDDEDDGLFDGLDEPAAPAQTSATEESQ